MYEKQLDHLNNKDKRFFYMFNKAKFSSIHVDKEVIDSSKENFPLIYLGCPIFHAKKKKVYFSKLMKKIRSKLQLCKGKLLSFRGNTF